MKKFTILIEETVVKEFEVEANTEEEARYIAQCKYKNGDFILSPGEVQDKQLAVIQSNNKISEWFKF